MKDMIISLRNIKKSYTNDGSYVLNIPTLDIECNKAISFIGRSGSGKSTLLNLLMTVDDAQGKYILNDNTKNENFLIENGKIINIKTKKRISKCKIRQRLGLVFQVPFILNNFSVKYNIALPLLILGKKKHEISKKVNAIIKDVGLKEQSNNTANQLSGGQRTRAIFARALIHEPIIIAADEPTGSLDIYNARIIMNLLKEACNKVNSTLILVTHDPRLALDYSDIICGIEDGEIIFQKNSNELNYDVLKKFVEEQKRP